MSRQSRSRSMSLRSAPVSVTTVWVYFARSVGASLRSVPMPMDLISMIGSSVVPSSMSPSAWAEMPYSSDQIGTSWYSRAICTWHSGQPLGLVARNS